MNITLKHTVVALLYGNVKLCTNMGDQSKLAKNIQLSYYGIGMKFTFMTKSMGLKLRVSVDCLRHTI